jgi:hypothetical protein
MLFDIKTLSHAVLLDFDTVVGELQEGLGAAAGELDFYAFLGLTYRHVQPIVNTSLEGYFLLLFLQVAACCVVLAAVRAAAFAEMRVFEVEGR